jgi:hypothetical protein
MENMTEFLKKTLTILFAVAMIIPMLFMLFFVLGDVTSISILKQFSYILLVLWIADFVFLVMTLTLKELLRERILQQESIGEEESVEEEFHQRTNKQ